MAAPYAGALRRLIFSDAAMTILCGRRRLLAAVFRHKPGRAGLEKTDPGNARSSCIHHTADKLRPNAPETENRQGERGTDFSESAYTQRFAVTHLGRGQENRAQQNIVRPTLRRAPGFKERMDGHSYDEISREERFQIRNFQAG